MSGDFVLNEKD